MKKNTILKTFLSIGAIAFAISSLAGCIRSEKYPDALKVGVSDVPKNLNPYASSYSANVFVSGLVYDTLLGNYSHPQDENYIFPDGTKPEELDKDNYFEFTDNLVGYEGAYPKKEGSKYGLQFYQPSEEDYQKQLERKHIVFGKDEAGNPKEETLEQFETRKNQAVPKSNWMRYRFEIKEGFTWSDGVPFTADDIVFTFNYALKNSGALAAIAYFLNNHFNSYNDDGDLVLELASNKLSDIQTICTSIFIIPQHIWKNVVRPNYEKNLQPVGTGLYKILKEDYIQDQSITMTLRDDLSEEVLKENFFYKPIKHIMLLRLSNEEIMLNSLENGGIDVSLDSITNTAALDSNGKFKNVKVSKGLGNFVTTLALNVGKKGVFNNNGKFGENSIKIREAISLAIDQKSLIKDVLSGNGEEVSDGLVQSRYKHALKDANGEYKKHVTDVEKANNILDSLGYSKNAQGYRDGLEFTILALKSNEGIARTIGVMLEPIGIKIDYEMATSTYSQEVKQSNGADFDMIINTVTFAENQLLMFDARFGVYSDGSSRLWNVTGTYDEELSNLMYDMDIEIEMFKQLEKSKKVQEKIASLYTEIPLYSKYNQIVYTEGRFSGFIPDENGRILNGMSYKYLLRKGN